MTTKQFDRFIIQWNNQFPFDHWYRQKYKIPFNSPQHQAINQIDVFFEWREEHVFLKNQEKIKQREDNEKLYKEGKWLKNQIDLEFEEVPDDLFDKIDVMKINQQSAMSNG